MVTSSAELERELTLRMQSIEQRIDPQKTLDISRKMELIERGFWPAWNQELKAKQLDASSTFIQYAANRYLKKQIKDVIVRIRSTRGSDPHAEHL